MYLKDVVSKHLIEEGPEFGDEEEEKKAKTYSEEQEDLREEFLNAVKEEEDLFKVKENEKREDRLGDDEEEGYNEFAKKLDEFFAKDEKLDEETVFLKDFFRKKMWKDDKKGKRGDDDEDVEFSEDEEEMGRRGE
ncbi:PREDICTED: trichohyalin-like isoform X2 [Nicotiana attenuata]|uniref:Uncharacterized protein n=1 Tax=Nicotiana attenuata TaxID=49451 RepID=A0A314KX93_NICAT|nr:PREDICTED: trichohyalin-like isoform X2 [Nicotiana attenuata]OIT33765.1 hypothetical protein A4A49_14490 [Nicotiana attenuata]